MNNNKTLIHESSPLWRYVAAEMTYLEALAFKQLLLGENFQIGDSFTYAKMKHKWAIEIMKQGFERALYDMNIHMDLCNCAQDLYPYVCATDPSVTIAGFDKNYKTNAVLRAYIIDFYGNQFKMECDGKWFKYAASSSIDGTPRFCYPRMMFDYIATKFPGIEEFSIYDADPDNFDADNGYIFKGAVFYYAINGERKCGRVKVKSLTSSNMEYEYEDDDGD